MGGYGIGEVVENKVRAGESQATTRAIKRSSNNRHGVANIAWLPNGRGMRRRSRVGRQAPRPKRHGLAIEGSMEHGTRPDTRSCTTYHQTPPHVTPSHHTDRKHSRCAKRAPRLSVGAWCYNTLSKQIHKRYSSLHAECAATSPPSPNCACRMLVSNTTSPIALARNTTRHQHCTSTFAASSSHYTQTATSASFVTVTTCSKGPLLHCRVCSRDRARARESVVTVG